MKKKKNLGQIRDYKFFASAVEGGWQNAVDAFSDAFDKKINQE